MVKYRPQLLIIVCLALTGLVWLDNRDFISSLWNHASTAPSHVLQATLGNHLITSQGTTEGTHPSQLTLGNPLVTVDKSALSNWVERPLFAPSRHRPPPQEAVARAVAQKAAPSYSLIGVIFNPKRTVALLRSVTGTNLHVEVGDTLGGWKVASVERTAVTLVRGNDPAQVIHFKQDCAEASGNCP